MFRLVTFREEHDSEREIAAYLSGIVSGTILDAMNYLLQREGDYRHLFELFNIEDFFEGTGTYFHASDTEVGYEIFRRKIDRMKQKMTDPEKYYTFDVLEERIFNFFIEMMLFYYESEDSGFCYVNLKKEERVVDELTGRFGLDSEEAEAIAVTACRFHEMSLEDEDDNLVFWDDDYLWFFEEGFVPGIRRLLSAEGEMAGYGYQYVKDIFEDIGLKAPLMLIGTEEAHKLANEETMRRYQEAVNRVWENGSMSEEGKTSWNQEQDEKYETDSEDLPFS